MIEIVAYRSDWPAEFQLLEAVLRKGLGEAALRIDHVGSTSVPQLCAKNVIDVQVTVAALDANVTDRLLALGFRQHPDARNDHVPPGYEGRDEDWRKLFFMQPEGQRRSNIHVRRAGLPNQRFALLFRDYLAAHRPAAAAYGELKRRLAVALAHDTTYPEVKDPAVDLFYFAAEQWAGRIGWQAPPRDA